MKSYRSSLNTSAATTISRPCSPGVIIVMVKTIIHRVSSKARRKSSRKVAIPQNNERAPPLNAETGRVDRKVSIELLPNEVLLEIFNHDRLIALNHPLLGPWKWQRLVHVCRSWRFLIFASPRRLELRLYYTYRKPVTQTLGCWPPFPISIWYPRFASSRPLVPKDDDNVVAALMHRHRICEINFAMTSHLLERSRTLMQESFPTLERLLLRSRDSARRPLVLPSAFLGGSAPRLRDIHLDGIAFPTLPQLLLSTRDLRSLQLEEIPRTEFFSPETLVNSMSALTHLGSLKIHFAPPTSELDQSNARSPSISPSHTSLPALAEFRFRGASEYLEDVVARLETPCLEQLIIGFFDQPVFEIPQLSLFIGRTESLTTPHKTSIQLWVREIAITQQFRASPCRLEIRLEVSSRELDRRVTSLAHICRQLFLFLPSVERLDVKAFRLLPARRRRDQIDPAQWLELFRPFEGVKVFEVTGTLVGNIASALEHATGEMTRDVFPALCDLRLNRSRESLSASVESFVAARQLSGRPIFAHYIGDRTFDYWSEDNQGSTDA